MSIKSVMPSNHLTLCRPLLPSVFPSIRVSSNELAVHIRWPKYYSLYQVLSYDTIQNFYFKDYFDVDLYFIFILLKKLF